MSDWNYNKKANFLNTTNGNVEREDYDFYATDPISLRRFLDRIKEDNIELSNLIWEPCCGVGTLVEVLKEYDYNVLYSDLIVRDYPKTVEMDFLTVEKSINFKGDILTNPPYKIALDIIKKALDIVQDNNKVIMYLKLTFLEGKERKLFYKENPPKYIYVFSDRQTCYRNGDFSEKKGSTVCYCWYIWEKGFKGEPIIRWI